MDLVPRQLPQHPERTQGRRAQRDHKQVRRLDIVAQDFVDTETDEENATNESRVTTNDTFLINLIRVLKRSDGRSRLTLNSRYIKCHIHPPHIPP